MTYGVAELYSLMMDHQVPNSLTLTMTNKLQSLDPPKAQRGVIASLDQSPAPPSVCAGRGAGGQRGMGLGRLERKATLT